MSVQLCASCRSRRITGSSLASLAKDWVNRQVLPADTGEGLRRAVMLDLMRTANADYGMSHGVAVLDGELCWHDVQTFGDEGRVGFLRELSGRPLSDTVDLCLSNLTPINRFTEVTDQEIRGNKVYRNNWVPMRRVSVLAMCAVVGGTHARWVGAYRVEGQGYFGSEVVKRVQSRAEAYVRCLDVARRLDRRVGGGRALILLSECGEIAFRSDSGRHWQSDARLLERLRKAIRAPGSPRCFSVCDAVVRITPVEGDQGKRLFCAEVLPVEEWTIPKLATLSVQKRRVAELAALGATAAEIARSLDVTAATVRTYLRQIYAQLGIATRLELAQHVREVTSGGE
jgi:DNA-binding CsgD family transcriptional regulator